jgi:hypothetical protein
LVGALVECSPALELSESEVTGTLDRYVFRFADHYAIALGIGSLFNHGDSPNCKHEIDVVRRVICFYATRDIHTSEELTIDYASDLGDFDPEARREWMRVYGIHSDAPANGLVAT